MAIQKVTKRRIVTSIHNLSAEIQEAVNEHYKTGFTDAMMRIDKPNGDFFYAVPYSTEDAEYLVKIDVKIDDKAHEEDDKSYYDEEIKEADEIADNSDESDDDM